MRESAPLEKIPGALEKTGFLLEHFASEEFQRAGWSVIGNRYYVDDVDGTARELDLVAYRIDKSEELDVVTGVLVSCKKDDKYTWAFMSKRKPPRDSNVEWEPVHYWTDVEPLASFLGSSSKWRKEYFSANKMVYNSLFKNTRNVFATQLVSSDGTSPNNDRPIFSSISGLFKALDHELAAIPTRQSGKKRLYVFTLLTIVEAPLVEVKYHGNIGEASEVALLTYLARYMVNKREFSAHVHFVRSDKLNMFVETLSVLADHNAKYMASLVQKSFDSVRSNNAVRAHVSKKLEARLKRVLNSILKKYGYEEITQMSLSYRDNMLSINVDVYETIAIEQLNTDEQANKYTRKALREIARYKGDFHFDMDIPF